MKKLQVFFAVLSMVIGIGGAFAFTTKVDECTSVTFYAFNPDEGYVQVTFNPTLNCEGDTGACYYYNAGTTQVPNYKPCPTSYGVGPHVF